MEKACLDTTNSGRFLELDPEHKLELSRVLKCSVMQTAFLSQSLVAFFVPRTSTWMTV